MTDEWYVIYFVYLVAIQLRPGLRAFPRGTLHPGNGNAPQL